MAKRKVSSERERVIKERLKAMDDAGMALEKVQTFLHGMYVGIHAAPFNLDPVSLKATEKALSNLREARDAYGEVYSWLQD